LHGIDALTELQTIFAEAVNDPGLRSQFEADIGELVRKLPHEVKAGLEDGILKAAADGDHSQVIERASGYLRARLAAEGV
jgi:DNA repair protein SbcD/Mre11